MKRSLFICNSPYQLLVTMWIKYSEQKNIPADVIISDHMVGGEKLVESLRKVGMFENVFYVKSLDFSKFRIKQSRIELSIMSLLPNRFLVKFVPLKYKYSALYASNVDFFTSLVLDALAHRNSKIQFCILEDGAFTYTKLYEKEYKETYIPLQSPLKRILHSFIYRKKTIFGNVTALRLFNPDNLLWRPDFSVEEIKKIPLSDLEFRELCNCAFSYYENNDQYDEKYIFIEESFFAEGSPINDVDVIEELSKYVGKNSIMVKIHPRNPVNRFEKLGYKTNRNLNIPWEVVLMNMPDLVDRVLITVSSSAVLNPILVFGLKPKVRSIYGCINHEKWSSRLLSGEMWEYTLGIFRKYNDVVRICNKIEDII